MAMCMHLLCPYYLETTLDLTSSQEFDLRLQNMMSDPVFPPEIIDYILDLLHSDLETLKQCCLVSKSWVPRSRQYLFANINFRSSHLLESWHNAFPDPTNSPVFHVRNLAINCYLDNVRADWIRTFSSVVQLKLTGRLPFALFHGLSRNLKSLCVRLMTFSCPELFNFICSFPFLEDLYLVGGGMSEDQDHDFHGLQTSPSLTGSLKLFVFAGMGDAPRHLLSLPNGLRFRELVLLSVHAKDNRRIRDLVLKCSATLECLDVKYRWSGTTDSVDLSKAKKLKNLTVRLPKGLGPGRVGATLKTITPEHKDFRQVSIYLSFKRIPRGVADFRSFFGDDVYEKWLEVDHLLVQFWESHSIRPKVVVTESLQGNLETKDRIGCLFPKITARRIIDLAEEY